MRKTKKKRKVMNSYNDFVLKILNNPVLRTAVEDMNREHAVLNLVSLNWKETILKSEIYKKHLEGAVIYTEKKSSDKQFEVHTMVNMDYNYHVIVAGCWKFHTVKKNDGTEFESIVCNSSQPLLLIGKSMAVNNKQEFIDNSRFFFQSCDANVCSTCEEVKKVSLQNNIWCVKNTKVFNGQSIRCLLRRDVLKAFGHSRMYGILRVKISSRTIFGNHNTRYKIGGLCSEMILFNESALDPPINIDNIFLPIETQANPEITFPEEAEVL